MHTTKVKLKDGTVHEGVLWLWRPTEGRMELGCDEVVCINLRDIDEAETEGERVGINKDGTATVRNVNLLSRARIEGWDGT